MTYGDDNAAFSEYHTKLQDEVRNDSKYKIAQKGEKKNEKESNRKVKENIYYTDVYDTGGMSCND